ncbi:hypothetical protein [Mesorhizobium sp. M7A.F.Ca.CA.004.02.1.1]|uniref:hypothetical protein n=1 Tax=Mesorhizobium sp. M7A.F.Ca.CA.004.02.1.1 TaxID=2496690 RepID=UPI000FCC92D1|nr:hypothetical protein [Mesorhizobium sp. M7A.F.Ca.CA.004.02.1.1]RVB05682.1 hypothetical protein EN912_02145 [Mesorhizobium sp. M7A.F.Ca.CA.004.02.1.1]
MKTDSKALASLFDAFAGELQKLITDGKTVMDKEGEIVRLSPDAASLNVIRQFLKDTNTTVAPNTNKVVNDIASSLPFDGSEHDDQPRH